MANSVVKVTDIKDEELDGSILLLVGEDGTVTPDQDTVETYLKQRNGPTNLQIMKFNRSEKQGVDITVDNVTYIPDVINEEVIRSDMDEVARNLYNFRLDHDYTPLTSPRRMALVEEEDDDEDELARTLSILDGPDPNVLSKMDLSEPPPLIMSTPKPKLPPKVKIIQSITLTPSNSNNVTVSTPRLKPQVIQSLNKVKTVVKQKSETKAPIEPVKEPEDTNTTPVTTSKAKIIRTHKIIKSIPVKPKTSIPKEKEIMEEENESDEDYLDDEKDISMEDDTDDSDFVVEEETKVKKITHKQTKIKTIKPLKVQKQRSKSREDREESKKELLLNLHKDEKQEEKIETKIEEKTVEKEKEETENKLADKKPVKKEKKPPKPIPNDFALFSTPDIIRRVGGKDPTTPEPAKISPDQPRKSLEHPHGLAKLRKSVDEKDKEKKEKEPKSKETIERRYSTGDKIKKVEDKQKPKEVKPERRISDAKKIDKVKDTTDLQNEEVKAPILTDERTFSMESSQMNSSLGSNLDTTGLDLDPSLLDNLNNDEIPEEILYQVAQSLVSNPELQNAIDKGINEGVLDPMAVDSVVSSPSVVQPAPNEEPSQGGTQIVRPDGRVVIIPPIERPTTRSRNKKVEEVKPTFKPVHKPLDDDHVSGNELDSSNDEEEESEDDPNKLWCICNQPHNNRFMICCDTCEEWYHGKCVNITKSMGQQMEAEGREWICLFCKDPSLKRPQAAARRIRKASRNSRTSTDSSGSIAKKLETSTTAIPCVVCQKPARKSSIYCSETCILTHAQGIERVVVFERATGKMLTGNKAPSASNLDQWLKEHPGYEVVRSGKKVVTSKAGSLAQTKLKLVKNSNNQGVSLAVQKKGGVNLGVMKHSPKQQQHLQVKSALKASLTGLKQPIPKLPLPKESPKAKSVGESLKSPTSTPTKSPKMVQSTLIKTPKSSEKANVVVKEKPKERTLSTSSKEKTIIKTPKSRKVEKEEITPQKPPENIRENVQKTVYEQLLNRLKGVEDLKLSEEEVKSISTEIELQLFKCFGDTGQKYRNKYRSLIFNIKDIKNQTLWRRICEKTINPYELVRLSTDDMANQELAQWREKEAKHQLDMIKKSELELLNCNRQYVLKTHKGEQVVEEDHNQVDNTDVIKSLTEGSALDSGEGKRDHSRDHDKKGSSKHSHRDREKKSSRSHRSSSRDSRDRSRKRSRSKDRRHSDRKKRSRSKERDRSRHRKSSHKSSRHRRDIISSTDKLDKKSKEILEQLVDNKIVPPLEDRLWKHVPQDDILPGTTAESDSDHEPTSTVIIPTPPRVPELEEEKNVTIQSEKVKEVSEVVKSTSPPPPVAKPAEVWRGVINMIDVAEISITAQEVSGDCNGLNKELSPNLDIVGRISPDTVWEYIGKMKCSASKGISLLRLNATNVEEKMPYLALYSYLSSRDRLGVVKSLNKAVKDFYIYPLAPQKPIPQVLLPLNGPGFEESRPALLLGIIVRDKRKRPYLDVVPTVSKKTRIETPPLPIIPPPIAPPPPPPPPTNRSYTPPPVKDPRLNKLSTILPTPVVPRESTPPITSEGDEPYSPVDSAENSPTMEVPPALNVPLMSHNSILETSLSSSSYTTIPGLTVGLPSSTLEVQRQIEELNKKIEMQKSEITSMTQNIVSASTEIGTSALANIALPTNLQQILDSIKSIGDTTDSPTTSTKEPAQSDLTIPLMIPKRSTRQFSASPAPVQTDLTSDTIPLKLPSKPLFKPTLINSPLRSHSVNSPTLEEKPSVLSSLSEEDLIKKAAEMLGEHEILGKKEEVPSKRPKLDVTLPPVPGLEDDM